MLEYKLTWEMPDSMIVDAIERLNGRDCWQRLDWDNLNLNWHTTTVVWNDSDPENHRMDQYHTLRDWAYRKTQPIRNVKLSKREITPGKWHDA